MKNTKNTNIFLDTNVILMYLSGDKIAEGIFAPKIIKNKQYYISSIVKQEIYLALNNSEIKITNSLVKLEKIFSLSKIIEPENIEISTNLYSKVLRKITTNLSSPTLHGTKIPHSNDVLNIFIALNKCKYFLTNDKALLAINKFESLKFISPKDYLEDKVEI